MEDNWVKIYSSSQPYRVQILQAQLEEQGIVSVIKDQPYLVYNIGEGELYVRHEDEQAAKKILSETEL
jgi:hypothetical protein